MPPDSLSSTDGAGRVIARAVADYFHFDPKEDEATPADAWRQWERLGEKVATALALRGLLATESALRERTRVLEEALPTSEEAEALLHLCEVGHPRKGIALEQAGLSKLRALSLAAVAVEDGEVCPACEGRRVVDENGNPYVWGRSDSYECLTCSPIEDDERSAAGALAAEPPHDQKCERLLVGQGTDTWDPLCQLPSGHKGSCSASPPDGAGRDLARGTLAQFIATGDGCFLDNADGDTLRDMVRTACERTRVLEEALRSAARFIGQRASSRTGRNPASGIELSAACWMQGHESVLASLAAVAVEDAPDECKFGMCEPDCDHEPPAGRDAMSGNLTQQELVALYALAIVTPRHRRSERENAAVDKLRLLASVDKYAAPLPSSGSGRGTDG